jgi:hypothetical protein
MIKVTFVEPKTKAWARWVTEATKAINLLIPLAAAGQKVKFQNAMYKRRRKEIFAAFYGKCAYCEGPLRPFQPGDVEHFRPKGALVDEHDKPVYLRDAAGKIIKDASGQPQLHPGYYWLAYNWNNLMPACAGCNRPYKKTRFPVEGFRAAAPGEEDREVPLFLNPFKDDPNEHLIFDTDNGILSHKTRRGEVSIELLGLNREGLLDQRLTCYDLLLGALKEISDQAESGQLTVAALADGTLARKLAYIIKCLKGELNFSFAARHALRGNRQRLELLRDFLPTHFDDLLP